MSVYARFESLRRQLAQQVVGQPRLISRLLIALLADGHLLVEGPPGLAKTRAVHALGAAIEGDVQRIQFTPDLLPGDLTGSEVYRPADGSFHFQRGPIFHNFLLADEINRAPAKVQSALLEAMAERQVSIGRETHALPALFLVMATQNPIEQEGTYRLPEAQLDRFMLHIRLNYPGKDDERRILELVHQESCRALDALIQAQGEGGGGEDANGASSMLARQTDDNQSTPADSPAEAPVRLSQAEVFAARRAVRQLHMSEALKDYIVELVHATRDPAPYKTELARWVQYGASPRATLALDVCARALAWLAGRDHVLPQDIQTLAPDVLRHRIVLSFEAEAGGLGVEEFIATLLARVPVP